MEQVWGVSCGEARVEDGYSGLMHWSWQEAIVSWARTGERKMKGLDLRQRVNRTWRRSMDITVWESKSSISKGPSTKSKVKQQIKRKYV